MFKAISLALLCLQLATLDAWLYRVGCPCCDLGGYAYRDRWDHCYDWEEGEEVRVPGGCPTFEADQPSNGSAYGY